MPMINCPSCGFENRVPREMVGLTYDCEKCRRPFRAEGESLPPEEQEYRPRRRPEGVTIGIGLLFMVGKWACLGIGGLMVLLSLGVAAIHAAPFVGFACFMGITARILQAEEHRSAR